MSNKCRLYAIPITFLGLVLGGALCLHFAPHFHAVSEPALGPNAIDGAPPDRRNPRIGGRAIDYDRTSPIDDVREILESGPVDVMLTANELVTFQNACYGLRRMPEGDLREVFRELLVLDEPQKRKEGPTRAYRIFFAFENDESAQNDLLSILPPSEVRKALLGKYISQGTDTSPKYGKALYQRWGAGHDRTQIASFVARTEFQKNGFPSARSWIQSLDFPEERAAAIESVAMIVATTYPGDEFERQREQLLGFAGEEGAIDSSNIRGILQRKDE